MNLKCWWWLINFSLNWISAAVIIWPFHRVLWVCSGVAREVIWSYKSTALFGPMEMYTVTVLYFKHVFLLLHRFYFFFSPPYWIEVLCKLKLNYELYQSTSLYVDILSSVRLPLKNKKLCGTSVRLVSTKMHWLLTSEPKESLMFWSIKWPDFGVFQF